MNANGTAIKYGDNIDTDVIIPARYLNTADHKELASHCMEDIDKDFTKKVKEGDIMIGGANFGCGSSREHAPIAIRAAGVVRMAPSDLIEFDLPYSQWTMLQQEARKIGAALTPEYGERIRCVAAVEAERTKAFLSAIYDQSAGSLMGRVIGCEYRPLEEHEDR